jgi:hypothetical protein
LKKTHTEKNKESFDHGTQSTYLEEKNAVESRGNSGKSTELSIDSQKSRIMMENLVNG